MISQKVFQIRGIIEKFGVLNLSARYFEYARGLKIDQMDVIQYDSIPYPTLKTKKERTARMHARMLTHINKLSRNLRHFL